MTPPPSLAQQAEALAVQIANAIYSRNPNWAGLDVVDTVTPIALAAFQRLQSETREETLKSFQELLRAIDELLAKWREEARLARPLETEIVSAEKRKRVERWMFYTTRANEVEAATASLRARKDLP